MPWWLNVFFLVNGLWLPGHDLPGWGPRPFATLEECLERKAFAEQECQVRPLPLEAAWICSPGRPLTEVPPALLGRAC